ncbi:MAG: polysaccharide biosynthesis/export family protein, partial [Burkholderiales bacterium]|nr:polysaccharide biosynthesis/export family protein [Burkholderiales bacterium]
MILLRTGLRGIRAVGGVLALLFLFPVPVMAQSVPGNPFDYRLGPGDVVRITVYNNPDLATEAQITRSGRITFPLLGEVEIGGLEKAQAEEKLARL